MRFAHFFIDRPIFAAVLSVAIMVIGGVAFFALPVAQYPEVTPPTIVVEASYPGASADVVARTVATPIEEELNGVEGMLYMSSQSTSDGRMQLTVTFGIGTDVDAAQVLVQNRVSIAEPRLPEAVRRLGVTTKKSSPDLMMVIHLVSPDGRYDQTYISNYATLNIRDELARLDGVGDAQVFGGRDYSMRVWLDPNRVAAFGMTAGDIVQAMREHNVQVAAGIVGQPPVPSKGAFQLTVNALGRLEDPSQFEEIVVKTTADGRVVRLRDVARVELGARSYGVNGYLDGQPALPILIFQRPGSNALETDAAIQRTLDELAQRFPDGLEHQIIYNPTDFVRASLDALRVTIVEAVALVVFVVILFLQKWRIALIPLLAIPVSLIGTFAIMSAFGFSLNNLSLFGLVLAIGIVVDDAIVVVENVERNLAEGQSPRDAARKAMDEVGGALIATSLVLVAVFVPVAFITGLSGQFYQQFALTIAVATVISAFNALTLSPALSALLLKENDKPRDGILNKLFDNTIGLFFRGFNFVFDGISNGYGRFVCGIVRRGGIVMLLYLGLVAFTAYSFDKLPTGLIPDQDQGYLIVDVQLPDGAAIERTDAVVREVMDKVLDTPGFVHAVGFSGFSGATFSNNSKSGAVFAVLAPFEERVDGPSAFVAAGTLQQSLSGIKEARILAIPPPPVRGLGTAGGLKMMIQDRADLGYEVLQDNTQAILGKVFPDPNLAFGYTTFGADTPQLFADVDRVRAKMLEVPLDRVFDTLQTYLGGAYVNDFNLFGRTYQVWVQADGEFRDEINDVAELRTRSTRDAMVPLGSLADIDFITAPDRVVRYNLYPAADLNVSALPGVSSGQAIAVLEELAEQTLPAGMGFAWTDIAFQEITAGNTAPIAFALAVLFVFLVLAAQYESVSLPFAIILIVPMVLLSALIGLQTRGMDNNLMTQIGLVVLVGLASKNAILIVEFAKQLEQRGMDRFSAASEAAKLRLRPILMTSFAFIMGVVPLMIATGAGAEMRQAIGTAVFSGMLGVTFFGLLLTPVFYTVIRRFAGRRDADKAAAQRETAASEAS
ncbi:MAG: multidrug efflux RND transporter permease subunit [Gammaproteobacteria bacterium]|nr:multidrug efflux RND transporter permease subunit [Gammaproteobacteria bacterium]